MLALVQPSQQPGLQLSRQPTSVSCNVHNSHGAKSAKVQQQIHMGAIQSAVQGRKTATTFQLTRELVAVLLAAAAPADALAHLSAPNQHTSGGNSRFKAWGAA